MASFNKVILMGNMVADPELKQTTSGLSVCSFRIAVNRRGVKNDNGQVTTDFFDIVAWRQSAEFVCRYFKKGNPILVCGQLQQRSWTDNQGQKRYTVEVVADEVTFASNANQGGAPAMGSAPATDAYTSPYSNAGESSFEEISSDDSLPF